MIIGINGDNSHVEEWSVCRYGIQSFCTQENSISLRIQEFKGCYTLYFRVRTPEKSNFAIVYQNGRETGAFAVPYTGNIDCFGRYRPVKSQYLPKDREKASEILSANREMTRKLGRTYLFGIPCIARGNEQILLTAASSCLNEGMMTYNGEGFFVEEAFLTEGIGAPESFYHRSRPGRNLVDLWGWMSMTSFEHPADRVTPFEEQARRGILEAYAWGANNFEFLPVNADGVALALEGEWEGSEVYRQSGDPVWSAQKVGDLIKEAKEHGMLTEFFLYCLHGAVFIAEDMEFQQKVNLFEQIVKKYGSCMEEEAQERMVDGIITEAWFPIDAGAYIERAWKWNPGFFHLVSNNDGSQYEMRSMGYTPATHAYSAHWPGFDTQHTGYDASYPLLPYPVEFYTQQEGTLYTYMQGCGQTQHPRKNFPRIEDIPFGITNRTVSPDWIIAQAHNYGLRNLWEKEVHPAMAMCWEADEQTMCPAQARQYVYAASQDPVRLASCCELRDTGAGGEIELKRVTRKFQPWDVTRLRKRSCFPADCIALGNRFLQMIAFPDRDESILRCDLSETASFYANGAVTDTAFPFVATRFRDNRFLEKELTIVEAAGPVAVLEERSRMGSGYISFSQKVRYEVYSELPAVKVHISRTMDPGLSEEITTLLGFSGYTRYSQQKGWAVFEDADGIMPKTAVRIKGGDGDWELRPGYGFFLKDRVTGVREMELEIFLMMGDYRDADVEDMGNLLERIVTVTYQSEEIQVHNATQLPMPAVVKIKNSRMEPCYVFESGYWQHRGRTFLQESPGTAALRLCLKPGETGRIRPYGYLDGILRPGPGCQNVLAFRGLKEVDGAATADILVEADNPMLHAITVEAARSIEQVWLDGEDYRYFRGKQIYLPSGKEFHKLRITWGEADRPQLWKTYGRVVKCCFDEESASLRLRVEHQQWVGAGQELSYKAVVYCAGFVLKETVGADVLNTQGNLILLKLTAEDIILKFGQNNE